MNDDPNENDTADYEVNQNKKTTGKSFFLMEMNIYIINIKTTVTWHHDYYGCQGYKKK